MIGLLAHVSASCKQGEFLGFPTWYKYLHVHDNRACAPHISGIDDLWKIGLALVEILLRIAVLAAIAFVLYAGIKYTTSRASPDKTEAAKKTLEDALVGLVIAVAATAVVAFIAGRFN